MTLLDRYILSRFSVNFAILFMLMFLFAVAIDLILALDKFIEVARTVAGAGLDDGAEPGALAVVFSFIKLALNFQAPRFFQFFAYLHGMVAIGAMGFTLAQFYRHKELVAMLAAGLSMKRIAMPFIVGAFALSIMQVLNQEFFLPRVAPLLLRDHGDIGQASAESFEVRLTPDRNNALLQAPQFEPRSGVLDHPTILERDDTGQTRRRVTAERATWGEREIDGAVVEGWELENGRAMARAAADESRLRRLEPSAIDFYPTDLSPRVLTVRRHGEYAAMLNLRQIDQVLALPGIDQQPQVRRALLRHRYARFAAVLVNVLVMWLALPSFLLREPSNLMTKSVQCAAIAVPALIGAALFMVMDLPGITPAVGVFLPVLILLPVVLGLWMYIRT